MFFTPDTNYNNLVTTLIRINDAHEILLTFARVVYVSNFSAYVAQWAAVFAQQSIANVLKCIHFLIEAHKRHAKHEDIEHIITGIN